MYPPPYSPDVNPIERLWQHLKSHYLAGFITRSHEEPTDKLEDPIRALLKNPQQLPFICRIPTS